MNWKKLGRIFCAAGEHPWMLTHAANPVAEARGGNRFRIYFSARNEKNQSSISYVDIDLTRPQEILEVASTPVVAPGPLGTFDDSGASMGCLVRMGEKRYLYYLGWNLGVTVPWRNSIGLAISEGAQTPFKKVSLAPILDRNAADPYSISYPYVLAEKDLWHMWYGSNLAWGKEQNEMAHVLKYAHSADGLNWQREGKIAIPHATAGEYAISKPCVVKEGKTYRMWYSYRGENYRIGYAESADGVTWTRHDSKAPITASATGWDSESVCYPFVFTHGKDQYLLYNGNAYGATGFGLARLVP